MTKPLEQVQAAAIAGLTVQGLQKIGKTQADAPPRTPDGLYPADAFGQWLKRRIAAEYGVADNGQSYNYDAERARLTKAQADKTELEAAELAGHLVRVDDIEQEWGRMLGAFRARSLSMATKAAPRARVAINDEEALAVIEAEVIEALQELSDDGLPPQTRERRKRALANAASGNAAAEADGEPVGGSVPAPKSRKRRRAGPMEN